MTKVAMFRLILVKNLKLKYYDTLAPYASVHF